MDKLPQGKAAAAIEIIEIQEYEKPRKQHHNGDPCPYKHFGTWYPVEGIRFTGGLKTWNPRMEYRWLPDHIDRRLECRCTIYVPYCAAYQQTN